VHVALIAPPAANPFTGGHLYNANVTAAANGGCELLALVPAEARSLLRSRTRADEVVVLDSLFLGELEPADWCGRRVLQLVHALPPGGAAGAAQTTAALAGAAGCITTSAFMAEAVRARGGTRVAVCRPGVTAAARPERVAGPPRVLTVANFESRKGHVPLLRVLESLAGLAFTWDVIGDLDADPACGRAFTAAVAASPLAARIDVRGRQEPAAVQRAMAEADVFALLSEREPYGMVYAESVASGTPVVAWRDGGVPESVTHERTGRLATPDDLEEAARHLRDLLVDADLRRRMQRACAAVRFPTWSECAARFVACCRTLAGEVGQ